MIKGYGLAINKSNILIHVILFELLSGSEVGLIILIVDKLWSHVGRFFLMA